MHTSKMILKKNIKKSVLLAVLIRATVPAAMVNEAMCLNYKRVLGSSPGSRSTRYENLVIAK